MLVDIDLMLTLPLNSNDVVIFFFLEVKKDPSLLKHRFLLFGLVSEEVFFAFDYSLS